MNTAAAIHKDTLATGGGSGVEWVHGEEARGIVDQRDACSPTDPS